MKHLSDPEFYPRYKDSEMAGWGVKLVLSTQLLWVKDE